MTSSSLLSFRRTNLRIPKPKTQKKKTMPKSKPTTKAKNRWTLVSKEMLTFNEVVIPTSVTADSDVSQNAKKAYHLKRPEVVAKRQEAVQKYWQKRREAREASKRYTERYGLKCISARVPSDIVDTFTGICKEHDLCQAEIIARLLTGFIQRNSYPNTK